MVVVPASIPLTMPLVLPMVADAILLLIQLPPAVPSLSVMVIPSHTTDGPVIAPGVELTVMVVVLVQQRPIV